MIQQRVMQALVILGALFVASASAAAIVPCPRPCKCFTTENGIQAANCTDLPDQMTTAWPQKILRIRFDGHRASPIMLKNKGFNHFPQLTFLDVAGGTVQYVGNSAFDGLPDLLELNLVGTGIRKLHRDTFATNRKLAFLSLKNNPRLAVAPSFLASESITELDLSECALGALKSVYFKSLPNLKYLFAMKNELKSLGSQFGPPGLKYVNLAYNHIENIYDDLDAYKRLRTIDLTGNPVNCTCELSETDKKLSGKGVAFGNTIVCKNTGKPLGDLAEVCTDQEMMGDDPVDMYKADNLLKIDKNAIQSMDEIDDSGSGSGSGDGELFPGIYAAHTTEQARNTTQITGEANSSTAQFEDGVEEEITKANVNVAFARPKPAESETTEPTVDNALSGENVTSASGGAIGSAAPTIAGDPEDKATTTRSGADGGIVPLTIQAPEDEVQTKVAEYLKSNVGITGTAVLVILAVVIVAIVYKAVCLGRSRRRGSVASDKVVELKEIKYTAANTEDTRDMPSPPASPAEENLLGDRDSNDDGSDDDDDDDSGAGGDVRGPGAGAGGGGGGLPRNGLSNGTVGDPARPDNNRNVAQQPPTTPKAEAPTRVIVRLGETPKASKPITINNVH
ncbi:Leucine-rich repeat domain, L domain-like [Cinara cedri]|uniref:Leucine-rich repeat domain, L domain-like n=1 Tax=Cinara cedri TaxID=506608 RepID=A0A5E4NKK1_9HEMI|nr:Leucine-rich repeat domain, L domain-like [Cinara cedri]